MNTPENAQRDSVESTVLLADLWWLEYQDAAEEARNAVRSSESSALL